MWLTTGPGVHASSSTPVSELLCFFVDSARVFTFSTPDIRNPCPLPSTCVPCSRPERRDWHRRHRLLRPHRSFLQPVRLLALGDSTALSWSRLATSLAGCGFFQRAQLVASVIPFLMRSGMSTWEIPLGYGRSKPDVMAYGRDVQVRRHCVCCTVLLRTACWAQPLRLCRTWTPRCSQ